MDKRAAIPPDEKALDRPLGEITAAEFIQILGRSDFDVALAILPDKKKYELWIDEGGLGKIKIGDLLEAMRREKKKFEREKWKIEGIQDSIGVLDPQVIDQIATQVAEKLRAIR